MTREVVVVGAVRTPIGKFSGSLAPLSAPEMGSLVIRETLARSGVEVDIVDEVIMGNALQAGLGQNPARQAALGAGIPETVPAMTINKVCGSGLKAVMLAAQAIRAEDADILVAGGMESMTNAPYLLQGARSGYRMGDQKVVDGMIRDGLWCALCDVHMGITAENVAERYNITREMQDAFSLASQQKAGVAIADGRFKDEILAISVPQRKGEAKVLDVDEFPRPDTTLEALAKLPAAFKHGGTITAGNASGINDGAAAVTVVSADRAAELGLQPMARIVGYATVGIDPAVMGIAPIAATRKALERAGLKPADLDLVELNEAFASQAVYVANELGLDEDKVNVNGGAIALGHPIGASGTRILVTLLYEMEKRASRYGLAALCIGGGGGAAVVVER
ncbi:MAG: acetyl-CoA C-acetyltransferase [Acidimicrobiales bacterium]|jgi:acetyl-CoA C-acetyltransferase